MRTESHSNRWGVAWHGWTISTLPLSFSLPNECKADANPICIRMSHMGHAVANDSHDIRPIPSYRIRGFSVSRLLPARASR